MLYNAPVPFVRDRIYFIFIDRFHDGGDRASRSSNIRKTGFGKGQELQNFYGGNFQGIIQKLGYIKKMGFTALWLSPFFHNSQGAYHGYAIKDFLRVDPNFGTHDDLKMLVATAHALHLKVYMDVIINHAGNIWTYSNHKEHMYSKGREYPIGQWTEADYPRPHSLRNTKFYEKKGRIRNWDVHPELMQGDFYELKKFKLDESGAGQELQGILTEVYEYWIKEFDIDGFRIDTTRHISPLAVARFTHKVKLFAKNLGKKEFPVFIEAPFLSDTDMLPYFTFQKDGAGNVYNPPDGFLDFYLHFDLPSFMNGRRPLGKIQERFRSLSLLRRKADSPVHQVTFLDNHDQVAESHKQRIAVKLGNKKMLDAWKFLLDTDTIPCMYYGTEQGLSGAGHHDSYLREAMFHKQIAVDLFDDQYFLYKEFRKANLNRRRN